MAEHSEQVAEHTKQEDAVSISIRKMLRSGQKSPDQPSIFKVPNYLRQGNKEAYEPQVISIGPYHRRNDGLQAMEQLKIQFLQKLLTDKKENDVSVYVKKMRKLKDKARKCYAADLDLGSDDFVEMLLLDGVFIVQMIRLFSVKEVPTGLNVALRQDMLLVENQLPYFVLQKLYCMIESQAQDANKKFTQAIFRMFGVIVPGKVFPEDGEKFLGSGFKHLFDFVYQWWHPSDLEIRRRGKKQPTHPSTSAIEVREKNPRDFLATGCTEHPTSCWCKCCCRSEKSFSKFCATKLQKAGIKFKLLKRKNAESTFDIRFENGTLRIPDITIGNYTGRFLRNLVAYEEMVDRDPKCVTDYVIFMDCLIDTPNDVEILCKEGIIINMLVDDKAVATMFNDLGIFFQYHPNSYSKVLHEIIKYCDQPLTKCCRRRWKRWMVNLRQNYFNSPWSVISVLAAAVLLILTVLQTIFSAK